MKRMRYWLSSKKVQMAQLHDLRRQLQEAWDARGDLEMHLDDCQLNYYAKCADYDGMIDQLHRVARERDNERKLRLAAEKLRDTYLEGLDNEEERND